MLDRLHNMLIGALAFAAATIFTILCVVWYKGKDPDIHD